MSPDSNSLTPRLQTAKELHQQYGIRPAHSYQLARDGILPHVRFGRRVLFDRLRSEEFLANGGRAFLHGWRKEPLS